MLLNFDASTIQPAESFDPIPAGTYLGSIIDTEMRETKAGNGSYLNMQIEILDGPYKGRRVFDRLNLNNPNPKAVEIAQRTLSAICHASGILQVSDSSQLHNIPMQIKVVIKPAAGDYAATNEIKGYKKSGAPAAPTVAPANEQPAPPATAATPW